ncbi:protein of unknown function [Lutibacter oricola]|uniref:Lumazine-binding n=1 Tax=Lutibacter oricola TaxID=762486 RepID=A0A1H2RQQ3_9FLAO|nr:nuclear transport factor 2 family protein [Lutibacter oricola]SDW21114.1 protein of unknown function [Lutibacter oricola]
MKKLVLLLFIVNITICYSQKPSQQEDIKNTLKLFFKAIDKGDTLTIKNVVHKNFRGLTTYINSNGNTVIADEVSKKEFVNIIKTKNPNDSWIEKLTSYSIKIDGNLANVWTAYTFYVNKNITHCGSNSFQLVKIGNKWKIISVIDTRRRENCN